MYDLVAYGGMIADGRTSSYARALEARIAPGSVILDIGAGFGILSLIACRAGAAKVYAVEPNDVIELGREAARDNGFSDRIDFIQAMTTAIELPEKVDGIVADLHGATPLFQKCIISILDARDRFLKPHGWIIPSREILWAAPVFSPRLYDDFAGSWNSQGQFDFTCVRAKTVHTVRATRFKADALIAPPQAWAVLEYKTLSAPGVDGALSWTIEHDITAHGLGTWFDCETAPGIGFSNSPAAGDRHIYRQIFLPWPDAIELRCGDRVEVRLRADFVETDYVWSWETRIAGHGASRPRAEFRQSTFFGAPLSRERLRKRATGFIPHPNEDSRIDYTVLQLMQRHLTLKDIARVLAAEFPARFPNWTAALGRAADLAEKYSK
jgi:protein arginine N-methyltransferase 1